MTPRTIAGAWAWLDGEWVADVALDLHQGRIARVRAGSPTPGAFDALVPAFHNAHSHAFQWAMRGLAQVAADDDQNDFWSWRERMYALAASIDPARLEAIATECYAAMRAAGFASVGEFHYLHHRPNGRAYDPPWAMASALARAAMAADLRLVLLPAAYHRGGAKRPLDQAQARFGFPDAETFIAFVRQTRHELASHRVSVGYAAHSVRAVPADWLPAIAAAARSDAAPLHIHASEQRRELEECLTELGVTPIQLLSDRGFLDERTTVVHATHATDEELALLADSGSMVCACPTTERDLGDGLLRARPMLDRGVPICFGTDSHTLVDAREEMRLAEYHERLRLERRNVLVRPERGVTRPATTLLEWATACGARSLGVDAGSLREGSAADIVALHLPGPPRDVGGVADAFDRWLFSTREPGIAAVWVRGRPSETGLFSGGL